jgi:hypothetical protein
MIARRFALLPCKLIAIVIIVPRYSWFFISSTLRIFLFCGSGRMNGHFSLLSSRLFPLSLSRNCFSSMKFFPFINRGFVDLIFHHPSPRPTSRVYLNFPHPSSRFPLFFPSNCISLSPSLPVNYLTLGLTFPNC